MRAVRPKKCVRDGAARGATLLELLIAMLVMAVVGGAVTRAITLQWRLHSSQTGAAELRDRLQAAADVLSAELRSVAPRSGDLLEVSDSAIEARETVGAAVICEISPAGDVLTLSESGSASSGALTWWRDTPAPGDSIAILVARAAQPDTFVMHEISGIAWGAVCPVSSGLSRSPVQSSGAIDLTISPPYSGVTRAGIPLRFMRRTRYTLYRSSADHQWYLGRREFVARRANPWTTVQPLAGPFLPGAAGGTGGLHAVARDSAGMPLSFATGLTTARELDIVLRAASQAPSLAPTGGVNAQLIDSVAVSIAFRNR
jgi:hypothetical protein